MGIGNPIVNTILQTAKSCKDQVAIEETGGKLVSYGELSKNIRAIASNLSKKGFKKGDRILFLLGPGIQSLTVVMAVLQLGGSVVLADPGMGKEVFNSRMLLAKPQWLLVDSLLLFAQSNNVLRSYLRRRKWELPDVTKMEGRLISVGRFPIPNKALSYKNLLVGDSAVNFAEIHDSNEIAVVFTSGTTDLPKGVVHSVASIAATANIIEKELKIQADDIFLTSHLFLVLPALSVGAKIVVPDGRKFSAHNLLKQLRKHGITKLFGIPHEFQQIIDICRQRNSKLPSTLRTITLGAAPVYTAFLKQFQDILPKTTKVYSVYGMSEILPVASVDLKEKVQFDGKGDLLGRVLPDMTVRITDEGEIAVTGKSLFSHYLGKETSSEHLSGDLGKYLPDGRLVLLGRKKDMIIKGNHNIYPIIFESAIREISGVKNCAMVGVYDHSTQDERVILVVEKDSTVEEGKFKEYLAKELISGAHSIDTYAQPDFIFFMQIPLSGRSQKVDKAALKERVKEKLQP